MLRSRPSAEKIQQKSVGRFPTLSAGPSLEPSAGTSGPELRVIGLTTSKERSSSSRKKIYIPFQSTIGLVDEPRRRRLSYFCNIYLFCIKVIQWKTKMNQQRPLRCHLLSSLNVRPSVILRVRLGRDMAQQSLALPPSPDSPIPTFALSAVFETLYIRS